MSLKYQLPVVALLAFLVGCKQDVCYCGDDDTADPLIDRLIDKESTMEFTVGKVKFKMVGVHSGTFKMGVQGTDSSKDNYSKYASASNAQKVHKVTLSGYYIGETEVSQGLWYALMGSRKNAWTTYYSDHDELPAFAITYTEAVSKFIPTLNERLHNDGQLPDNMEFALPTEAQWEYAARGGKKSNGTQFPGSNKLSDVAYNYPDYPASNYLTLREVKTFKPNELGLYNMAGNVAEWCFDFYEPDYESVGDAVNPTGPEDYSLGRVSRGGGYRSKEALLTVFGRTGIGVADVGSSYSIYNGGLRLCLVMKDTKSE